MRRRFATWSLLTFALAAGAGSAAAPPPPIEHIVRLYASGPRAIAILRIGDAPPAPVVFDTGTDQNLVASDYSSSLRLPSAGTSESIDMATGKKSILPVVELPLARLGGVALVDKKAQVLPGPADESVGIFGPGSFGDRLVTLELGAGRLRVTDRDAGVMPLQAAEAYVDGLPATTIEVSGMRLKAHLDSGSTGTLMLPKAMMTRVKLKAPARPGPIAYSASGSQQVYVGQIDGDLKVGPRLLRDPQVSFSNLAAEANVGFRILKDMTLVLDPARQRSWLLDPAVDVPPLATLAGSYGELLVALDRDRLTITQPSRAAVEVKSLGSALFEDPGSGDRFQFLRVGGHVTGVRVISAGGRITTFAKR